MYGLDSVSLCRSQSGCWLSTGKHDHQTRGIITADLLKGMHELLAVCFWVIDRDSLKRPEEDTLQSPLARDSTEEAMYTTLDQRYIEHDAYVLFIAIMKSAKSSYEWRSEEMSVSRRPRCQSLGGIDVD